MISLSEHELARRLPVWAALAELFVGKELQDYDYRAIATALRGSGYPVADLEGILYSEVYPVFSSNISVFNPTPEMEPWSLDEVRGFMLAYRHRRRGVLAALVDWARPSPLKNPVISHNWGQVKTLL